ncbi:MAG: hypothetical protein ACNA71_09365, partial [Kiritimatiellia bacterium]
MNTLLRKSVCAYLVTAILSCAAHAQLSAPGWRHGNAERVDVHVIPELIEKQEGMVLAGTMGLLGDPDAGPEIEELARGLQYDPVRIFNFVRNRIAYTPYYGALKGATMTLLERSGNDFDQAALLTALL